MYSLLIFAQVFDPIIWRRDQISILGLHLISETSPEQAALDGNQEEDQNQGARSHKQSVDLRQDREGREGPCHQGRVATPKRYRRKGETWLRECQTWRREGGEEEEGQC